MDCIQKAKAGIKLHALYDVRTSIPIFLHTTTAYVLDVNILDHIPYETGNFYIVDKGCNDSSDCAEGTYKDLFFVTRGKGNMRLNE